MISPSSLSNARFLNRSLIIACLLLLAIPCNVVCQDLSSPDSTSLFSPIRTIDINNLYINDIHLSKEDERPSIIAPAKDRFDSFLYDTLQVIASKNIFTKTLYDLIIVPSASPIENHDGSWEETEFDQYEGKTIRNIEVSRLDVFGSSITGENAPTRRKVETLLNKTHVNTNESVIRKNLLFSSGDKLSALVIRDNERFLRNLPYINDSKIVVSSVDDEFVDILVLVRDVYSLGASYKFRGIDEGFISLYDKNALGFGHELKLSMPYNGKMPDSPGIGVSYTTTNLFKSFINLELFYIDSLGLNSYGFNLSRNFVSSSTKYNGGMSIRKTITSEDLDTLDTPKALSYVYHDYWLSRSFLLNENPIKRVVVSSRYIYNHVIDQPYVAPGSYHDLQDYKIILGSLAFSSYEYSKTSLLYAHGRTEDVPYGGMIDLTLGRELGQFSNRTYGGITLSNGFTLNNVGYLHTTIGVASFFTKEKNEQRIISANLNFFSDLSYIGTHRLRNFVKIEYTRGIARYYDESLRFHRENGFSGFSNDSISGIQRFSVSLESVFFSPRHIFGFRFAYFAFGDVGCLWGSNEQVQQGHFLTCIGLGIRIRTDNLVFNALQIRLGYYPSFPTYSNLRHAIVSGEQLLRPDDFDPGRPTTIPYR